MIYKIFLFYLIFFIKFYKKLYFFGCGVWGWGGWVWGFGPTPQPPKPQSPIPNPLKNFIKFKQYFILL